MKGDRGLRSMFKNEESTFAVDHAAQTRDRIIIVIGCVICLFAAIQTRLVALGFQSDGQIARRANIDMALAASRPRLLDRNGQILALDIQMQSLFAEPRRIENPDESEYGFYGGAWHLHSR